MESSSGIRFFLSKLNCDSKKRMLFLFVVSETKQEHYNCSIKYWSHCDLTWLETDQLLPWCVLSHLISSSLLFLLSILILEQEKHLNVFTEVLRPSNQCAQKRVHVVWSCFKQLTCVCLFAPCRCRLQCVVVVLVGRVAAAAAPAATAAAGRLPGLLERLWRMTAARLAAESRWTNGVSCPNGGRMAHGKVTITVDEYSSNPTQAFTHYNINQSRFQPPHVHM